MPTSTIKTERSALIISPDPAFSDRLMKAIGQTGEPFHNVTIPNPANAVDRAKHKTFDLIVLFEKHRTLSGSYVIKRINELKNIELPRSYLLVTDEAPPDLPPGNILIVPPSADETQLLDSLKKIVTSLKTADPSSSLRAKFKVDVNFINPFIESTVEVLSVTCKTTCTRDKVYLRNNEEMSGDISALVGMNSSKFRGSMGIAFPRDTFLYIVNSMLDTDYKEINPENQDAAGEICNQIFGMTKTKLNDQGYNLQPAIPSIIVGNGHRIKHMMSEPVIAVQFKCSGGTFLIEAAVVAV